ncbi:MAG: sensor histidine kinase, partial [Nitrospinota bacterium]
MGPVGKKLKRIAEKLHRNKVQNKILIPVAVVAFIALGTVIFGYTRATIEGIKADKTRSLLQAQELASKLFLEQEQRIALYAQFMADVETLSERMSDLRVGRQMVIYLLEALKREGMRAVIRRGADPDDPMSPLIRKGMLGIRTVALVPLREGGESSFVLGAVSPMEGRPAHEEVMTVTFPLSRRYLATIKAKVDAEVALILPGGSVLSTLPPRCEREVARLAALRSRGSAGEGQRAGVSPKELNCGRYPFSVLFSPFSVNFTEVGLFAVALSMEDVVTATQSAILNALVLTAILLTGILLLYVIIIKRITRPIQSLSLVTKKLAQGQFGEVINPDLGDEIGELARSFNQMSESLRNSHLEIEEWNRTLERRVEERAAELREAQRKLIHSDKMASIGVLAAGLAHELNNPICGIMSYAQCTLDDLKEKGDEKLAREDVANFTEFLTHILEAAERCSSIIQKLLKLSRTSHDEFGLVEVNQVLDESFFFIERQFSGKKIRVVRDYEEGLPPLEGNFYQLQQVFINLSLNAIRAMPEGGKLMVSSRRLNEEKEG